MVSGYGIALVECGNMLRWLGMCKWRAAEACLACLDEV